MADCEVKKSVTEILYQQLQLLVEKIEEEENVHDLRRMFVDFRYLAETILKNNPTEEQKKEIFEFLFSQIKFLTEKKSVFLTDTINDLAKFVFNFS